MDGLARLAHFGYTAVARRCSLDHEEMGLLPTPPSVQIRTDLKPHHPEMGPSLPQISAQNRADFRTLSSDDQSGLSGLQFCVDNCTDDSHHEPQAPSPAALSSLLRRCGNAKSLSQGRLLHARIIRYQYDGNTFLSNCLVQMYGNCGSLQDAKTVFDNMPDRNLYSWNIVIQAYAQNGYLDTAFSLFSRMPQRDVVSWNAIITASAGNGRYKEALSLFRQLQNDGIKPNRITFLGALDACTSMAVLEEGKKVHALVRDSGYERDVVVGNALVNMYAKCGSLDGAITVLSNMPRHSLIFWSGMISAYARNGHGNDALHVFWEMQFQGIKPDKFTFIAVLTACASLEALPEGQQIHASIIESGHEQDVIVANSLLNLYYKCGSLDDAKVVFSLLSPRDVVSWTTMVAAYSKCGQGKVALELFHEMHLEGIKPNQFTIVCAIEACASFAALEEGQQIHANIDGTEHERNVYVGNALINMYGKCKSLEIARNIFSRMPQRNVVSWNAMITTCAQNGSLNEALSLFGKMPQRDVISWNAMITSLAQNGHGREALDFFHQMQLEGISPNKTTFVTVLDVCTSMAVLEEGLKIHASVIESGYEQDVIVGNVLVHLYGKCGSLNCADSIFYSIHQRNVVSWSAIITAYIENGHRKEALRLFWEMQLEGVTPDGITFTHLLNACATLAALEEGLNIHVAIVAGNFEGDLAVGNALLNMYGKCGNIQEVRNVFNRMPQRDVISWTAIIAGCAKCGEGKEALELFTQMKGEGIKPDGVTFIGVLTACCHTGWVDEGRHYFVSMVRDHGLIHLPDHYVCMIDLLGRTGHLDEAEDMIASMPYEKNYMAWLSLLGACSNHGDLERGLCAALCCLQLNSNDAAPFTLLSNILVTSGDRDGKEKVKEVLRNKQFESCHSELDKMLQAVFSNIK